MSREHWIKTFRASKHQNMASLLIRNSKIEATRIGGTQWKESRPDETFLTMLECTLLIFCSLLILKSILLLF